MCNSCFYIDLPCPLCRTEHLSLLKFRRFLSVCFWQAVMPVSSNPALQCIYHSFKFGVIQESDEDAFHAIFQVVNGNISWCLPRYQPLKTGLVTTCPLNLEPLTIVFCVWWCNQFHAFIWTISCQLADKGTRWACVKSPVKARENETCCSLLSHRACYFIVEVDPCCLGQSVLFVLNQFCSSYVWKCLLWGLDPYGPRTCFLPSLRCCPRFYFCFPRKSVIIDKVPVRD